MSDRGIQVIWCTAPSDQAPALAEALVGERLVACVNVIPGVMSTYRWQGKVETDAEVLLMMKTTEDRVSALESRIQELHPYEVPEVLAMPVPWGAPAYLDWVRQQVADGDRE